MRYVIFLKRQVHFVFVYDGTSKVPTRFVCYCEGAEYVTVAGFDQTFLVGKHQPISCYERLQILKRFSNANQSRWLK